jgi:hypothetical protein
MFSDFQVDILINNAGVTPVPGVHLTPDNLGKITGFLKH